MRHGGQNFNPRAPCGARHPQGRKGSGIGGISIHAPRVGRDDERAAYERAREISIHAPRVGRDCAYLHGLNYSGRAIFFANLIFGRAVTGIFRRKVLCVIRVRTEILRLFSRRRCLLQHQSSFSLITWFCTDVLRFSCVFIAQIIKTQAVFFLVNQRC